MILLVDVGNTNIVLGLQDEETLKATWRFATLVNRTADEYRILLSIALAEVDVTWNQIEDIIVSSVVPDIVKPLEWLANKTIGRAPLVIGAGIKTGLHIRLDQPQQAGSDLIVCAVAAFKKYGGPTIIVDFGTATTMSVVNEKGEFLGGAIAPGITLSSQALFEKAAKIPNIPLELPPSAIGANTTHAVQSGLVFGYAGLVDGIVSRMQKDFDNKAMVVATGGQAQFIAAHAETVQKIDTQLMFEGLKIIYDLNKK